MTKTRFALMPIVVAATVLLQLAMPVIARADDGTPPPEQPTEVATDPGTGASDGSTPTDVATPVPVATDAAAEAPAATEVPVVTDASTPTPEVPLMTQVPQGTDVVVLNADGTVEPLATQAAADIIHSADPMWCPGNLGDTPLGDPSCITSPISLTDLLTNMDAANAATPGTYSGAGVIYFEQNYDGTASGTGEDQVSIDQTAWGYLDTLTDLTLQGGWDGSTGYSGQSTFNVPLSIFWTGGTLTLNNLTVDGSLTGAAVTGDGLSVYANNGLIDVQNVVVNSAGGNGASIITDYSPSSGDAVTVNNSTFSNNAGGGLAIVSTGTGSVSISGVTTHHNSGWGLAVVSGGSISVTNSTAGVDAVPEPGNGSGGALLTTFNSNPTLAAVVVTDSQFNNSGDCPGLEVYANGDITLQGVIAQNNSGNGAELLNTGNVIITPGTTITTNDFSGNGDSGLTILSSGYISTLNVAVNGNAHMGAYLDNHYGPGAYVDIQDGTFNDNGWTGLHVDSADYIYLDDVTASDVVAFPQEDGAYLDASWGSGNVSVSNSFFDNNTYTGLSAYTNTGAITLDTVEANGNGDYGAGLASYGGGLITVTGGTFDTNNGKGLWIETPGDGTPAADVLLTGAEASDNGLKGAYIHYMAACGTSTGGVDVTVDAGTYQNNVAFGVYAAVGLDGSLTLLNTPSGSDNGGQVGPSLYDFYADNSVVPCPPPSHEKPEKPYNIVNVPETGGEPVSLDCEAYAGLVLILPDGNRATVVCTVSGEAQLVPLTGDGLPGSLPVGMTFLAGLNLVLTQDGVAVPVILEGGHITLAFPIPEDKKGGHFAILFWDPAGGSGSGAWVEMPPYEHRPDGSPMLHHLHPGADPDDKMLVIGGAHVVGDFVKASVNFPGTFVLVEK
jgi:hypothetical protein